MRPIINITTNCSNTRWPLMTTSMLVPKQQVIKRTLLKRQVMHNVGSPQSGFSVCSIPQSQRPKNRYMTGITWALVLVLRGHWWCPSLVRSRRDLRVHQTSPQSLEGWHMVLLGLGPVNRKTITNYILYSEIMLVEDRSYIPKTFRNPHANHTYHIICIFNMHHRCCAYIQYKLYSIP